MANVYYYMTGKGTSNVNVWYCNEQKEGYTLWDPETSPIPSDTRYHIELTNGKFVLPVNATNLCKSAKADSDLQLDYWDTSECWVMNRLFLGAKCIYNFYQPNFDTSNVRDMEGMFSGTANATSISCYNWNTSNVTTMRSMFGNCGNLTNIDVTSFDTSHVTDMAYMFSYCSKLVTLNLCNFTLESCTTVEQMFYDDVLLTTIYAYPNTDWNRYNVTNQSQAFAMCSHLYKSLSHQEQNLTNANNITQWGYFGTVTRPPFRKNKIYEKTSEGWIEIDQVKLKEDNWYWHDFEVYY